MAVAKRYNMLMSQEAYEAFSEIAAKQNRLLADVIREALDNHLRQYGYQDVSAAVDRGGYRPRKDDGLEE